MAIKDLFNKIINKTDEAAEETAQAAETAADQIKEETQDFMQGHRPPEPPKDENGNPIKPPEGMKPPFGWGKPAEDGNTTET